MVILESIGCISLKKKFDAEEMFKDDFYFMIKT